MSESAHKWHEWRDRRNRPQGAGYQATSQSTLTIEPCKPLTFTTQAGLAYSQGARARASFVANGIVNFVEEAVTDYSGNQLTINPETASGGGASSQWDINLAGTPGAGY